MMCGGAGAKMGLDITGYEEKKRQVAAAVEAQNAATKAQELAAQQAKEQAAAQEAMQKNFATDLSAQNLSTVVAGGSAEQTMATSDLKTKRKKVSGLSSALGINV